MGSEAILKMLMRTKHITARKLAELVGMKHATLANKLRGRMPFKYDEVVKICRALEIENPIGVFEER